MSDEPLSGLVRFLPFLDREIRSQDAAIAEALRIVLAPQTTAPAPDTLSGGAG